MSYEESVIDDDSPVYPPKDKRPWESFGAIYGDGPPFLEHNYPNGYAAMSLYFDETNRDLWIWRLDRKWHFIPIFSKSEVEPKPPRRRRKRS